MSSREARRGLSGPGDRVWPYITPVNPPASRSLRCSPGFAEPVVRRLAEQLGVHHEALRNWIRQDQADRGERHDRPSTDMVAENRRLRREVAEPRRANEIPKAASACFAAELGPTRRRS